MNDRRTGQNDATEGVHDGVDEAELRAVACADGLEQLHQSDRRRAVGTASAGNGQLLLDAEAHREPAPPAAAGDGLVWRVVPHRRQSLGHGDERVEPRANESGR